MSTLRLGYRQLPDARDERYPLSALMEASAEKKRPVSKVWKHGGVQDQGDTNGCVGAATFQFLISQPIVIKPAITWEDIYREALDTDEFPGNADEGTSVRAGLNVLKRLGLIHSYFWAKDGEEASEYLLKYGPIEFGTEWHEDMFNVNAQGVIRPTGPVVGGHAWFAYAYDWGSKFFWGLSSWGENELRQGGFKISLADVNTLMKRGGVAAAVLEA